METIKDTIVRLLVRIAIIEYLWQQPNPDGMLATEQRKLLTLYDELVNWQARVEDALHNTESYAATD